MTTPDDFVWNSTSYLVAEVKTCPACGTLLQLSAGTIGTPMIPAVYVRNKSEIYIHLHEGRIWSCATCEHCEEHR